MAGLVCACVYACIGMCINAETTQHLAVNTDRPTFINHTGQESMNPSVYTHRFSLLHNRFICQL